MLKARTREDGGRVWRSPDWLCFSYLDLIPWRSIRKSDTPSFFLGDSFVFLCDTETNQDLQQTQSGAESLRHWWVSLNWCGFVHRRALVHHVGGQSLPMKVASTIWGSCGPLRASPTDFVTFDLRHCTLFCWDILKPGCWPGLLWMTRGVIMFWLLQGRNSGQWLKTPPCFLSQDVTWADRAQLLKLLVWFRWQVFSRYEKALARFSKTKQNNHHK